MAISHLQRTRNINPTSRRFTLDSGSIAFDIEARDEYGNSRIAIMQQRRLRKEMEFGARYSVGSQKLGDVYKADNYHKQGEIAAEIGRAFAGATEQMRSLLRTPVLDSAAIAEAAALRRSEAARKAAATRARNKAINADKARLAALSPAEAYMTKVQRGDTE